MELELTEAERTERTKKLVMLRKKKMRESRPTTTEAGGGEAAIHIRGAGLQGPTSPGGTPQELSEPAPGEAEVTGTEVDRTVSAELYHSLLSNPKLTDEQRQAIVEMQAKRTADEAAPDEDPNVSGELLQQWLSRTPSRQDRNADGGVGIGVVSFGEMYQSWFRICTLGPRRKYSEDFACSRQS